MADIKKETINELTALVVAGSWIELVPYFNVGKLLICQDKTKMVEIGAMLVLDQDEKISKLAEIGAINPPSNENISEWSSNPEERIFEFLEIPPYCLAQLNIKKGKRGAI